ncbi:MULTISPECIES: hypothetical protein [unclassified Streptomyces]|nr:MULTISPECIES: hypothetical protein [unclassified Streptomyces]
MRLDRTSEPVQARIFWLEGLESLFDERAIDPVDPQRPSVV